MSQEIIFRARELDVRCLPKIDCHLHTSWTDGEASVQEVYLTAVASGLEAILYSEHSRKSSTDWFGKFAQEVRELPSSPCRAYVGTEVKIESRLGDIDTTDAISKDCDFIIASVHRFIDAHDNIIQFADADPQQALDIEYELSMAALKNPKVDILGHMFGMSYRRFGQIPPEEMIRNIIRASVDYDIAIEVNSYYHPNALIMVHLCQEYDAKVAFGSNAHSLNEIGGIIRQLNREITDA